MSTGSWELGRLKLLCKEPKMIRDKDRISELKRMTGRGPRVWGRKKHKSVFGNKMSLAGYPPHCLIVSSLGVGLGLSVASRREQEGAFCPCGLSIEGCKYWMHDKHCWNSISPLPFFSFILSSDLLPPDGVLPSGYRNWIRGKRNSRMLEFQERFQDAKKNSSVMSRWHCDGRSGK